MLMNSFGIARSTIPKAVHHVCQAITLHLGPKYITLAKTEKVTLHFHMMSHYLHTLVFKSI